MHHKHHHLIIATYALLVLAAPLIWANGAHAQGQAACPTGYTCTPIQQVTNCPSGFYCAPITGGANTSGQFSNGYYLDKNAYTNSGSAYVMPTTSSQAAGQNQITVLPASSLNVTVGTPVGIDWAGFWNGNDSFDVTELTSGGKGFVAANVTQSQAGCTGTGKGVCGLSWIPDVTGQVQLAISDHRGVGNVGYSQFYTVSSSPANTGNTQTSVGGSCYVFGSNLGIGSTGADVSALQRLLLAKGYTVSVSGTFDYQTANAVIQYQTALGIPATGFVGPLTRAHLNIDCSSTSSSGGSSSTVGYASTFGVLYPNGGENLSAGQPITITFNPAGAYGQSIEIDLVNMDNHNEWQLGMVTSQATDKQAFYTTLSPTLISGNYKIRALVHTNYSIQYQDLSDNTFRISASPTNTTSYSLPSIASVSPNSGGALTSVIIYGSNLSGASSVEFFNSAGQMVGSIVPSYSSAQSVSFTISGVQAANMSPGTYMIGVVTNNCPGGCDSNRLSFTLSASAQTASAPLSASCSYYSTTANNGLALVWAASATGGTKPYAYSWSVYNDVSSYTTGSTQSSSFGANYSSAGTKQAVVRVTDAAGSSTSASCSGTVAQTATIPPVTTAPSTVLLISLRAIKLGELVTLVSNTSSPSSSLKSAAIDMSTDNVNWTSGAPCGYWNSSTGTDSVHAITCNFTPAAAGTYYFRSRGTDSVGASDFVYQTLVVGTE